MISKGGKEAERATGQVPTGEGWGRSTRACHYDNGFLSGMVRTLIAGTDGTSVATHHSRSSSMAMFMAVPKRQGVQHWLQLLASTRSWTRITHESGERSERSTISPLLVLCYMGCRLCSHRHSQHSDFISRKHSTYNTHAPLHRITDPKELLAVRHQGRVCAVARQCSTQSRDRGPQGHAVARKG